MRQPLHLLRLGAFAVATPATLFFAPTFPSPGFEQGGLDQCVSQRQLNYDEGSRQYWETAWEDFYEDEPGEDMVHELDTEPDNTEAEYDYWAEFVGQWAEVNEYEFPEQNTGEEWLVCRMMNTNWYPAN